MLSLLLILFLAYGFYVGARRGLVMQAFFTVGYAIFFVIALVSFKALGPKFEMIVPYPSASLGSEFAFFSTKVGMELDDAFYRAFAFIFICFIGWIIVRFVGLYFKRLTYYPMFNDVNLLSSMRPTRVRYAVNPITEPGITKYSNEPTYRAFHSILNGIPLNPQYNASMLAP